MIRAVIPACAAALLLFALPVPADADSTDASSLYKDVCSSCHGTQGELKAYGKSRPIGGLDETTILEALTAKRSQPAKTAGDRAKAALSEDEVKALAAYVSGLSKP